MRVPTGTGLILLLACPLLPRALQAQQRFIAYRVPSEAMAPTFDVRDILYFDLRWQNDTLHRASAPTRGDIILFRMPNDSILATKRVLGLPGDTVSMADGTFYLDGQPVTEPYIQHLNPDFIGDSADRASMASWQGSYHVPDQFAQYSPTVQTWGPLVVPDSQILVLGDNRDQSYDSRYFGFLPRTLLIGVIVGRLNEYGVYVEWPPQ